MKPLLLSLLAMATLVAAPGKQTFSGVVTDSMCANGDHSQMRMGPNDAECTKACVDVHGASYVIYDDPGEVCRKKGDSYRFAEH